MITRAAVTAICTGFMLVSLAAVPARAQVNPDEICGAQNRRQACSYQCCGRRSCPPTCEVDCVKVCVDACAAPDRFQSFIAGIRQLQVRCGNRSLR